LLGGKQMIVPDSFYFCKCLTQKIWIENAICLKIVLKLQTIQFFAQQKVAELDKVVQV
jgi:hypothetical protein